MTRVGGHLILWVGVPHHRWAPIDEALIIGLALLTAASRFAPKVCPRPFGPGIPRLSFGLRANFAPPRQFRAPSFRTGISVKLRPRRQRHPRSFARRRVTLFEASPNAPTSRRRRPAPRPSSAPQLRAPAPRPSSAPQLRPPGPVSRRSFTGRRPAAAASCRSPNAQPRRRQLQAPPASCMSLAKRSAPPPPMSGITPGLSAEAPCLLAVAPDAPPRRWKTSQPAATLVAGQI